MDRDLELARESATRPYVDGFADEMEAKLAENRHKGDREGWRAMRVDWLLARLREEVEELAAALPKRLGVRSADDPEYGYGKGPRAVIAECADVANFAMMIADVAGGLKSSDTITRVRREAFEECVNICELRAVTLDERHHEAADYAAQECRNLAATLRSLLAARAGASGGNDES